MPSYLEVVKLAQRTIQVKVRGVEFTITENLMRDPTPEVEGRRDAKAAIQSLRDLVDKAKTAAPDAAEPDGLEQFEAQLAALEVSLVADKRDQVCKAVSQTILSWDVTEEKGKPVSLDAEKLYASKVPTLFLEELLDAVRSEPIVPNGKA